MDGVEYPREDFDYLLITWKIGYYPLIFLMAFVMILKYGWMILMGPPITGLQFPVLMLPVLLLLFFIAAIGEDVGWLGYTLNPLPGSLGRNTSEYRDWDSMGAL